MKVTITVGETSASMDLQAVADAVNAGEGELVEHDPRAVEMEARDLAGQKLVDLFVRALDGEYTRFKNEVGRAHALLKELM